MLLSTGTALLWGIWTFFIVFSAVILCFGCETIRRNRKRRRRYKIKMSHKANLTVLWGILGPFFLVILIIICIGCEFVRKDRKRRRRYLIKMSTKANLNIVWGMMGIFFLMVLIIFCIGCEANRRARKRRRQYLNGPTVTVTSTAQTVSPQVIPPYPIDARHPTPANNAPGPGFTTHHQAPYPTHTPNMPFPQVTPAYGFPVPPMNTHGAPSFMNGYPRQMPFYGTNSYAYRTPPPTFPSATFRHSYYGQTPYLPASYQPATNDYSANPPSYEVAVSQPPIQPQTKEGYVKQAPYNPGYN